LLIGRLSDYRSFLGSAPSDPSSARSTSSQNVLPKQARSEIILAMIVVVKTVGQSDVEYVMHFVLIIVD